jgi:hypothetical protein
VLFVTSICAHRMSPYYAISCSFQFERILAPEQHMSVVYVVFGLLRGVHLYIHTRANLDMYSKPSHTNKTHATAHIKRSLRAMQVEALLRQCNLDEKIYAVRALAKGEADRLADMAGMDPLALSIGLKQFYGAVLTNSLEFKYVDKLASHVLRQKCREQVCMFVCMRSSLYVRDGFELRHSMYVQLRRAGEMLLSCMAVFSVSEL